MEDLNMFVPNVHFEKIPIKFLESSQNYQRSLSRQHIAKAVADFDLYQVNPVSIPLRLLQKSPALVKRRSGA